MSSKPTHRPPDEMADWRPPDEMADFLWRVPNAGFTWSRCEVIGQAKRHRVLRPLPSAVRVYAPLLSQSGIHRESVLLPGIHRDFVGIEPTEDGTLAFANRYGLLGMPKGLSAIVDGRPILAETLAAWQFAHTELRLALTLHDHIQKERLRELASVITWSHGGVHYRDNERAVTIASPQDRPDILARFQDGDLIEPAKWFLQRLVNQNLDRFTVTARLLWDTRKLGKFTVHIVPKSLIGCMWLLFAKELEGRSYRQCRHCLRWFEIGGSRSARADKQFCTASCKAAFHSPNEKSRREKEVSK